MSALVDDAIARAGLGDILAARHTGLSEAQVARLRASDLLVLGALADRARAEDVGPEVRIFTSEPPEEADECLVILPREGSELTGLELLREVAIARIAAGGRPRVRVNWARCGLELAQVALGFGANELIGPIASKRGLPLAEGELLGVGKMSQRELAHVVKRRELAACVERGGRVPVFVVPGGQPERAIEESGSEALQEAT
ncbi:MAG: hypothetical protein ACREJ3_00645 [Polyangiaceae bacterium]